MSVVIIMPARHSPFPSFQRPGYFERVSEDAQGRRIYWTYEPPRACRFASVADAAVAWLEIIAWGLAPREHDIRFEEMTDPS